MADFKKIAQAIIQKTLNKKRTAYKGAYMLSVLHSRYDHIQKIEHTFD